MSYQLREDLSYCDVDGHMIFLDLAQDRYFRLAGSLEEAMRSFLANEDIASTLLENLASVRILVDAPDLRARAAMGSIQHPSRSAIEQAAAIGNHQINAAVVLEVMVITWWTYRQLKTSTLKTILDNASAYRDRRTKPHETTTATGLEDSLLNANRQFARVRRYVPIEPTCLLDSLSLLQFLSRRGLSTNIVIGVTPEPFAAHCWVQANDIVLNETLTNANAYTPIRTI